MITKIAQSDTESCEKANKIVKTARIMRSKNIRTFRNSRPTREVGKCQVSEVCCGIGQLLCLSWGNGKKRHVFNDKPIVQYTSGIVSSLRGLLINCQFLVITSCMVE